jgi:hypothetical protein
MKKNKEFAAGGRGFFISFVLPFFFAHVFKGWASKP